MPEQGMLHDVSTADGGQLGRNLDQLGDDRDHVFELERYETFDFPDFAIGDRTADEAWQDVQAAANRVNFMAPDLDKFASRLWSADIVKWLRSAWFVIFPIVAACRPMRSVNDLETAKRARASPLEPIPARERNGDPAGRALDPMPLEQGERKGPAGAPTGER